MLVAGGIERRFGLIIIGEVPITGVEICRDGDAEVKLHVRTLLTDGRRILSTSLLDYT